MEEFSDSVELREVKPGEPFVTIYRVDKNIVLTRLDKPIDGDPAKNQRCLVCCVDGRGYLNIKDQQGTLYHLCLHSRVRLVQTEGSKMSENEPVGGSDAIIEKCAVRVETYALSLELSKHIGLPDPIEALYKAAEKIREYKKTNVV